MRLNPTTVQNVVTYNTVIDFSNPDEKLLPGETAYVTIPTGHAQNAVLIPNAALTFKPTTPSKELQALYKQYNISREASRLTSADGRWSGNWDPTRSNWSRRGPMGITDYNNTQLVQGDLKEGDTLVIAEQVEERGWRQRRPPGFGGGGGPALS